MSQDFNDPNVQDPRPSSPVVPVRLGLDDKFQFHCHYDLLRLKHRLGLTSREFLRPHTFMFEMDGHGMPGVTMKTKENTTKCQFLTPEGCSVYDDEPVA